MSSSFFGIPFSSIMNRQLEIVAAAVALLITLVGGTITVENRYAKAQDVKQQLDGLYAKQLKTRILELQLKPPSQFSSADRALLDHLKQELREVTE
jgi:hypothetical protein